MKTDTLNDVIHMMAVLATNRTSEGKSFWAEPCPEGPQTEAVKALFQLVGMREQMGFQQAQAQAQTQAQAQAALAKGGNR